MNWTCRWLLYFGLACFTQHAVAEDWTRFRGENGSGVASGANHLPSEFGPSKNLMWRVQLPGPGHSCPIIVGDRVFVTCWSGYGTSESDRASPESLKRHLVCLDRMSGKTLWDRTVDAVLPEDDYQGMFAEHGYASHTPVSDGKNVYAFFGKSGVHAFDVDGKFLWKANVGEGLDPRRWGSSSSPILFENLVIVLASAESETMIGLDKSTGKEVWKKKAEGFAGTWGTPILVQTASGETELVVGVPYEVWGFNPSTGKFKWFVSIADTDSFCSSVVASGETIYAIEGRAGGGYAIRAGGKDDSTKTNLIWEKPLRNRIGTPVVHEDRLYFIAGGIARCVDAKSGETVYENRLPQFGEAVQSNANQDQVAQSEDGGRPRRGGRGGGGGMGGQDYSSPVVADGKLYFITRSGDIHVIKLGDKFESLAVNRLTSESEDFSASPAVAGGQLFIRSNKYLYCVSQR